MMVCTALPPASSGSVASHAACMVSATITRFRGVLVNPRSGLTTCARHELAGRAADQGVVHVEKLVDASPGPHIGRVQILPAVPVRQVADDGRHFGKNEVAVPDPRDLAARVGLARLEVLPDSQPERQASMRQLQ